jgi:CMP-2-keto-3-deoxyoctulosonic acid synthetase
MKIVAMIPARYDSERLPGKLMMDLGGIPIILKNLLQCIKFRVI